MNRGRRAVRFPRDGQFSHHPGRARAHLRRQPLKELTRLGYFTSEAGATQALRYDPVPREYRGSVKLAPADRSWAS